VNDGSSRLAIPLYRLGVVLRDALAVGVDEPESVLSVSVTLLGCLAKPIRYSRGEATFRLHSLCFQRTGSVQSSPSTSAARSCDAVSRITPLLIGGQRNDPARAASRTTPPRIHPSPGSSDDPPNYRHSAYRFRADLRSVLRAYEANDLLYAAIDEAISRKPKGHDFIIDRRHRRPALARHMSVTGG
jgi:hypothetical protein